MAALNRSVYFLKSFEEAVGTLSDVAEIDGYQTAIIGDICVGVPENIAAKLQPNIGSLVGLLKTDMDYLFWVGGEQRG